MQTRIITIGLIVVTAFLGMITIVLWSASQSAATANGQNRAIEQLIKVNDSEIEVGKMQVAEGRQQLAVENAQLHATIEEINANSSHKVAIKMPSTPPTPSTSSIPSGPIIIAGSDGPTWPSSYGAFLSGVGAFMAAGTAAVVAILSRRKKDTENSPSRTPETVSKDLAREG